VGLNPGKERAGARGNSRPRLTRSLRLACVIAAIIGLASSLLAWWQMRIERRNDLDEITQRASVLVQPVSEAARYALLLPRTRAEELMRQRLDPHLPVVGYAVFQADGQLAAAANREMARLSGLIAPAVRRTAQTRREGSTIVDFEGRAIHILTTPVAAAGQSTNGVAVLAQDVSDVDERGRGRLLQYSAWILIVSGLTAALVVATTWFAYERPLAKLAAWMRRLRTENVAEEPPSGVPSALLRSESHRLAASFRAARHAGRQLSRAAVHSHEVWTRDRLRAHVLASLGEHHQLIVVSNREPYMHQRREGELHLIVPAGGVVTALEPVLRACGGVWIAHGAGDGDRETADESGRLAVPPGDPRYTLRRIWLTRAEEQGYYYGFANEGLWPLCHLAHERPVFRAEDWRCYSEANRHFAEAVLEEVGNGDAVVLVQDYQLGLVPGFLKRARPDLQVGLFWHIPWPHPDAFRICPWGEELLAGILSADLVGFHLQQYCNNFLDTVDRMLEARLDWDRFVVELRGHSALVRPFPISVQSWADRNVPTDEELDRQIAVLKTRYKLEGQYVAVSVGRIDYTKGLPERFRAVDRFLEKHPEHRGRFVLVEMAAPSRTHIRRYREHQTQLEALADEIDWKHQINGWKPIVVLIANHDAATVHAFLRMASMCIVSSLHDGMNLVAKEYVAAQAGGEGVLILSEFAGAAQELSDALIVNPYDTEGFAETIHDGITMDPVERRVRMQRMQTSVEQNNVYRWAARFVSELAARRPQEPSDNRSDTALETQAT
jgi:trehalose 6-phosphate synthase